MITDVDQVKIFKDAKKKRKLLKRMQKQAAAADAAKKDREPPIQKKSKSHEIDGAPPVLFTVTRHKEAD